MLEYRAETDEKQVSVRIELLDDIYNKFFDNRYAIEELLREGEDDETAEDKAKREKMLKESDKVVTDFEKQYIDLKSRLREKLPRPPAPPEVAADNQVVVQQPVFSKVKLPDIRLPSFSGKMQEWICFRDTFLSLIDQNGHLTDMDRYTYLRSSLSGEALQEINNIDFTAINYSVAWQALMEKYENKKLLVKAYLDILFELEPLRRESYQGLSHLVSEFEKSLQMLAKLGEKAENWSTLLVHMICSRLDSATLREWESHHKSKEVPTYTKVIEFLKSQCSILQSIARVKSSNADQRPSRPAVCNFAANSSSGRCRICNEPWHTPFQCNKFQTMSLQERIDFVMQNRLCRNCLKPGHLSRTCERGQCRHCRRNHHTMLHITRSSVPPTQTRPQTANPNRQPQNRPANTNQNQQNTATDTASNAIVRTGQNASDTNQQNTSHACIALPITPTQNILLSTALVKLKFKQTPAYLSIQGIGPTAAVSTKVVSAEVCPRSSAISSFAEEMEFHVLPKLTIPLPTATIDPEHWKLPDCAQLADPQFFESKPIDLIIGAEFFMDLLREGKLKATEEGPTLQETVFGWIISGRVPNSTATEQSSTFVVSTAQLQADLAKFWELETCRNISTHSLEESACEEFFDKTTVRDEQGRFVVTLPKKNDVISRLGESKATAVKRLMGMERRFAANPELQKMYADFMHEYEALDHMEEVVDDASAGIKYYLPHHAVLRPDSTTTKLRVVFDASCATSTGVSLNDGLMVGPVVQDDLFNTVIRFRFHRYALVADIAKMYRMVRIAETDRPLQRIVWRKSPTEPVRTFELKTVTYGTASAPYLATKCLQRLAADGEARYPLAAKIVKQDFYVDDLLTGVDDLEEGMQLINEILELMESAGLSLRKWNSNCKQLLWRVPEHLRDGQSILEFDAASYTVKTLGLIWESQSDTFRFSTPTWNSTSEITKRVVASDLSMHWDPLGVAGPVVVQAKIFVQQLWRHQYDWDAPLKEADQEFWLEYRRNLKGLEGLSVPRWIGVERKAKSVQIHGFCDASTKAYGACLYVRTEYEDGEVVVNLLTAKSRVAPIPKPKKKSKKKTSQNQPEEEQAEQSNPEQDELDAEQTIPRLELSSALLLAHLYDKVANSLPFKPEAYFWTDSMITLCQIKSPPSRWKTFVANRVSEIQHLTRGGIWNHVPGTENPADIISRGMTPAQLQYQSLWFHGPCWLKLDKVNWPHVQQIREEDLDASLLEERSVAAVLSTIEPSHIFSLNSSLTRLVRGVAYGIRFCHNAKQAHQDSKKLGPIPSEEYEDALKRLVRIAQQECFQQEIADLKRGHQVQNNSRIAALNPQLVDGLLCVGGRLQNANVSASRKHPYILDHRHPFTETVIADYHVNLYHAGQQLLLSAVRGRFWPTSARNVVRKVIHSCVSCFRARPRVQNQLMADLPPERVNPCFAFQRVGVDYCGPFYLVHGLRRGSPVKCFVAVFVCLVTKAVHLELVANLTTEAFLAALKRFSARRGKPELIKCDNATNFVGASRELKELHRLFLNQEFQARVVAQTAADRIEFQFIPARTPNFGGLWESAVKSFKTLLKRTVGARKLFYDEMQTILTQIEAILNSRPLTPLSNDPNDFEALTPGHFLIHRPLVAIPEPDLDGIPENRLSAWQAVQHFVQTLWKIWTTQYLSDLHNRTKWTQQKDNIRVGTMVVLMCENIPPLKWPLARVIEVHPGQDGCVRVVTVRTKDGTFKRGVSKICVLPIRDNTVPSSQQGEN
ncbi:uncharacterized protein LOC119767919 [Culex quinquefasciatus]|uniref:uncharacterized protein LOC119767919 n=1 Tax=Culex quinquefasciatus TaxID=7176 RepID=UPI0018E3C12E|nr:uncharacterized protein LOC119767919 [Culex quinquefasciatus]